MCKQEVYDYYAIINGEEIKVDYCFTNVHGVSYCEYNGYTYHNVPSRSVVVDIKEDCTYLNSLLIPAGLVVIYLFTCAIEKIFLRK